MTAPSLPLSRERLLLGMRGEGVPGLSEDAWNDVIELAQRHSLMPILHRNLMARYADLQVPQPIQSLLRETYLSTGIRNTRLVAQLTGVLRRLREAGIDVVVLKGAHLAELVYQEVALRPMADVDLLFRSRDLGAATRLLRTLGYVGVGGTGELKHQEPIDGSLHLEPMRKPGGLIIEPHYAIARMKDVDIEGLWSRAQKAAIGGAQAMVLAPEDLLLHLCIHVSLQHGFEINLLHVCDIPAVVDHYRDRIDWSMLWARARAWGVERSVLVMLALSERLLGWRRPVEATRDVALPPASFDVLALAQRLLFEEGPSFGGRSQLHKLWGDGNVTAKMRLVVSRAFPSRAEMAFMHGVPAKSWKVPMLYPLRVGQLLVRYAGPVLRAVRAKGDSRAALEVAKERGRIIEWLGE